MIFTAASMPRFLARPVDALLGPVKVLPPQRLPTTGSLLRELPFELADLIDQLLDWESYFYLPLPAQWPRPTVGDWLEDTVAEIMALMRLQNL
jgi:hypothetical protein